MMFSTLSDWPPVALATVVAALASAAVALVVAFRAAAREARKRRGEISVEITKLLLDPKLSFGTARRFAVGVLKVTSDPNETHRGLVLFIPLNSRVTVGRDETNDISLPDLAVSRFHCGFVSEGKSVFLEDYCSTNGVLVNDIAVMSGGSTKLRDGDEIAILDYRFRYQGVHCSRVLG